MFTNPEINVDRFNGNATLTYANSLFLTLQHIGASNECGLSCGITCKINRITYKDGNMVKNPYGFTTSNPKGLTVKHDAIKENREAFKEEIMEYLQKAMGEYMTVIYPGISIAVDRVIEEYFNTFIGI